MERHGQECQSIFPDWPKLSKSNLRVAADLVDGLDDQPLLLERRRRRLQDVQTNFFEENLDLQSKTDVQQENTTNMIRRDQFFFNYGGRMVYNKGLRGFGCCKFYAAMMMGLQFSARHIRCYLA